MSIASTAELRQSASFSSISAENELLLKFSKTIISTGERRRLAVLAEQDLNWERFGKLAFNHGTFALIWRHLRDARPALLNNPFFQPIEHHRNYVSVLNAQLAKELVELCETLKKRGIEAIPFKGPVLALQAYGDLSARPFLDLDIIVARHNVADTQRALVDLGYHSPPRDDGELSIDFMCSPLFQRLAFENTFIKPSQLRTQPTYLVDVHWEVASPHMLSFDFDYLINNCVDMELCGSQIHCLKPELLLVILCAHGTKHKWEQLKWIVDVVELIRQTPELNWDEVYKIACANGISRKIDLALLLAARGMEVAVPETLVTKILSNNRLDSVSERIIRGWTGEQRIEDNLRNHLSIEMLTCDSALKRWSFVINELLQPTVPTYLKFPLPEAIFPLYHIIQPARTAFNFGMALFNSGD